MKPALVILSAVSFGSALAAVYLWPLGLEGRGRDQSVDGQSAAASASVLGAAASGGSAERKVTGSLGGTSGASAATAGTTASTGGPAPTMDEVFKAAGLDRMLLMGRFIQTATAAELEQAVDRCQTEYTYEPNFQDQLWLRWVELDREAALNHRPQNAVWWALAKLDPEAALREGAKGGRDALGAVISSIAQGHPAKARQLLAEHPEVDPRRVEAGLVEGLEKTDPAAAMTLALEKANYSVDANFRSWLDRDQDQAMEWMKGIENPAQRAKLEDVVFSRLLSRDPAAGLEAARQMPAGIQQLDRSVEAISALAREDPAAARAAADAQPTPLAKQRALAALAGVLAGNNDRAAVVSLLPALDWAALGAANQGDWSYPHKNGGGSSGSTGNDLSGTLMGQLMTAAPQETANALAAMTPGTNVRLMPQAVSAWADRQPEAASSWLQDQPEGPSRDLGIQGLTSWLMQDDHGADFSAALAWSAAASPALQDSLINDTLAAWKGRDTQAAAAAVAGLPVSDERKAAFLRNLNPQ